MKRFKFFESFFRCNSGNTINTTVYSIDKLGKILNISPWSYFPQVFAIYIFERSNIPFCNCPLDFVFGCI